MELTKQDSTGVLLEGRSQHREELLNEREDHVFPVSVTPPTGLSPQDSTTVLPNGRSHGRKELLNEREVPDKGKGKHIAESDSYEIEITSSSDRDSHSDVIIDSEVEICRDLPNDSFDDDNETT